MLNANRRPHQSRIERVDAHAAYGGPPALQGLSPQMTLNTLYARSMSRLCEGACNRSVASRREEGRLPSSLVEFITASANLPP